MAVDPGTDENVEYIRGKENILIWVDEGIECVLHHMPDQSLYHRIVSRGSHLFFMRFM
jgi:hypothetical protein